MRDVISYSISNLKAYHYSLTFEVVQTVLMHALQYSTVPTDFYNNFHCLETVVINFVNYSEYDYTLMHCPAAIPVHGMAVL